MAINGSQLGSALKGAMNQANNTQDAHSRFANKLAEYLNQNLKVNGTYQGLMPNGSPDPSNGTYKWKPIMIIQPSSLSSGAQQGFNGWVNAITNIIKTFQVVGTSEDSVINTLSPSLFLTNVTIDFSSKPDNMDTAFAKVGEGIVTSLLSTIMNPISVPAVSTNGGTGSVTFTGVE
jgi:hypothetical protein